MAMLGMINPQSVEGMATTEDQLQKDEFIPADTWDVTKAQFSQFRANTVSTSQGDAMYNGFQERNEKYASQFNSDFPTFEVDNGQDFDFTQEPDFRELGSMTKQRLKQIRLEDDYIIEQRAKEPNKFKDILTSKEIYDRSVENANATTAELSNTMGRASGFAATVGSFAGSVAGAMTDPINIATMPFGVTRSAGILKTALTEAAIAAGSEAAIQPAVASWQKQLGQEYGLGDMIGNIAAAGTGGFIIGGGVKTASHMFTKARMNPDNTPSTNAALDELNKNAMVDEAQPLTDIEDASLHFDTIKMYNDKLKAGEPVRDIELAVTSREFNLANEGFKLDPTLAKTAKEMDLNKFQNKVFYDIGDLDVRSSNVGFSESSSKEFIRFIKNSNAKQATLVPIAKGVKQTRSQVEKKIKELAKEERVKFPNVNKKFQKTNMIANKNQDGTYDIYRADSDIKLKKDPDGKINKFNNRRDLDKSLQEGEYAVQLRKSTKGAEAEYIIVQGDLTGSAINTGNIKNSKFFDEFYAEQPKMNYIKEDVKAPANDMPQEMELFDEPLPNKELNEVYESLKETREIEEFNAELETLLEERPKDMVLLDDGTQVSLKKAIDEVKEETNIIDMMRTCAL